MMITDKTYIIKYVMYLFFLFLLAAPVSMIHAQDVDEEGEMFWGDEEEGLSRQEIRFLNSIEINRKLF